MLFAHGWQNLRRSKRPPFAVSERDGPQMERHMKANTTMHGDTETSGTKFFTWAILVVVAGVLVAMTADVTSQRGSATAQTTTSQSAS